MHSVFFFTAEKQIQPFPAIIFNNPLILCVYAVHLATNAFNFTFRLLLMNK